MTSTHTYAILDISPEAHAEIKAKLLAADYRQAIDGDTIDMHGIVLRRPALLLDPPPPFVPAIIKRETLPITITWPDESTESYEAAEALQHERAIEAFGRHVGIDQSAFERP